MLPRVEAPRKLLWGVVVLVTSALLGAAAPRARSVVGTATLLPPDDPYVRLNREITAQFGMRNPVVWVVEARRGSIWNPEILKRVQALTQETLRIPGVIPAHIVSVASPNLRDVEFSATGEMRPVYLMGQVPETQEEMDALRRRVEDDPNYRGTLVSLDGRAAIVVADFRTDVNRNIIAERAIELKGRYSDEMTRVAAAGAPLLARVPPESVQVMILVSAGVALLGLLLSGALVGLPATLAAALAALLGATWTLSVLIVAGLAVLPWAVLALPASGLIAMSMALGDDGTAGRNRTWCLAFALVVGSGFLALCSPSPARVMGLALALGAGAAWVAGRVSRPTVVIPLPSTRWSRNAGLGVIVVAVLGLPHVGLSLGQAGYGLRYAIGPGAADLRLVVQYFPPPSALVVRARGKPGFVSSPEVLRRFDAAMQAAREDPAVLSAMSLADVVKMVNWAFNEKREEHRVIPEDPRTIGRNLMLAYSPGFERFVDRALASSAMWVYVRGDRVSDLSRVRARIESVFNTAPLPDAEVDLIGGDGAEVLVMARLGRQLSIGGALGLLLTALIVALLSGPPAAFPVLLGGSTATVVSVGFLGWLRVPMDLLTIPLCVGSAMAGAALGSLSAFSAERLARIGTVLAIMAVPLLLVPYVGGRVIGALMLAAASATWVNERQMRENGEKEGRRENQR